MLHYYVIPALKNREDIDFYKCYLDIYPERVLEECADFYRVTIDELLSKNRSQYLVSPRQMAAYILRYHTTLTYKQIGSLLNNADHTNVQSSIRAIERGFKTVPSVKAQYNLLINRLK